MDYIDAETGENISLALETMIADLDGYDDLRTRSRLIPPDEVRELLKKADKALDTTLVEIARHNFDQARSYATGPMAGLSREKVIEHYRFVYGHEPSERVLDILLRNSPTQLETNEPVQQVDTRQVERMQAQVRKHAEQRGEGIDSVARGYYRGTSRQYW